MVCVSAGAIGCSPALDWREVAPDASGINALFPCRPAQLDRSVALGDARVDMHMQACAADGATFALTFADVAEPAAVTRALAALRASAAAHLTDAQPRWAAVQVEGMTPNDEAARMTLDGRMPDGSPLQQQSVFFAHGLRIYQASVVSAKLSGDAANTFFAGLRFAR